MDEILHLLRGKARQYYLLHPGRVYPRDGVIGDVSLSVEPVAEAPDGAVVGVPAVGAGQPGQEGVDAFGGKVTGTDEWT